MKMLSTTLARKRFSTIVDSVRTTGKAVVIGRRDRPEVMLVRAPQYNHALSDELNFAANTSAFDFLYDEPDLYSDANLKWRYGSKKHA